MKKTAGAVLAVLTIACGSEGGGGPGAPRPLQYAAPQPPIPSETSAATTVRMALYPPATFSPTAYGGPGLADQLVSDLGGSTVATSGGAYAATPSGHPAGTALSGPRLTAGPAYPPWLTAGPAYPPWLYTSGVDPACVTATATSATWNACVVTFSNVDPLTGDRTDMTVTVNGTLSSNPATGATTWSIVETIATNMTMTGTGTMVMNATVGLDGTITVGPTTIVGSTSSSTRVTGTFTGSQFGSVPLDEAYRTTLALDLGYETVPAFCISSGSLTLEQRWTQRPVGMTSLDLPDQGWRFDWTACDVFQVSHGS